MRRRHQKTQSRFCRFIESLEPRALLSLSPAGVETIVNQTTANDQFAPSIAADAGGNYVAVWASNGQDGSGYGIFARRFNSLGTPLGGEFQVNLNAAGDQSQPSIAMTPGGAFVVTWTSLSPTTSGDIYYRRFNSFAGALDGADVPVNTFATGNQESPRVAIDGAGNFAIAWDSEGQDGSSYGIYARKFNVNGTALTGELQVNQFTPDLQADPTIAMDRSGNFIVAWNSGNLLTGQDGSTYGIYARRYSSTGVALSSEFQVNTFTVDFQTVPSAAMDVDGDFVIAWQSFGQDGFLGGIYARKYSSNGTPAGIEFQVNTTAVGNQITPVIDMNSRGDFTIAWNSIAQDGSLGGIYLQSFDFNANFVGSQTAVNTTTANDQSRPAISLNANGDAVVVWQSNAQDGSGYGIYSQRYTAPDQLSPTVISGSFNYLLSQTATFIFSESVAPSLDGVDVLVQSLTPTVTTISSGLVNVVNSPGNVATITFPGYPGAMLPDGNYRITLLAAGVNDLAGNGFDGDNNGSAGGSYTLDFFVLAGDANRDRHVDSTDLAVLAANWQASPRNFAQGDFNYDARVDITDLYMLASRWQTYLAPPAPAAEPVSIPLSVIPKRQPVRVAASVLS